MDITEIKKVSHLIDGGCVETNCEECEYRLKIAGRPYSCKLDEDEALVQAVRIIEETENDLRIMFNRCEATAKLLTSGGACKKCRMKEKCERLTKMTKDGEQECVKRFSS